MHQALKSIYDHVIESNKILWNFVWRMVKGPILIFSVYFLIFLNVMHFGSGIYINYSNYFTAKAEILSMLQEVKGSVEQISDQTKYVAEHLEKPAVSLRVLERRGMNQFDCMARSSEFLLRNDVDPQRSSANELRGSVFNISKIEHEVRFYCLENSTIILMFGMDGEFIEEKVEYFESVFVKSISGGEGSSK